MSLEKAGSSISELEACLRASCVTSSSGPRAQSLIFDEHNFWIHLSNSRVLGVPLAYFPRLMGVRTESEYSQLYLSKVLKCRSAVYSQLRTKLP